MKESLLQRINDSCDRFEQDWMSGSQPDLKAYLHGWTGDARRNLFRYLLELDIDYRRIRGDSPVLPDYEADFSDLVDVIEDVLSHQTYDPLETTVERRRLPTPSPGIPKQLGRYRVVETLGEGGMGAVYVAHDDRLDRLVAIKIPFMDPQFDTQEVFDRFIREARALAATVHPNICPIHEVSEDGEIPFMVMTYVQGKPLSEKSVQPESIEDVVTLVGKLAGALNHSHQVGVVHRDLKPSNVIINQMNEPIIIDFGLADLLRRDAVELTAPGSVIGTPAYMSPEQVEGATDIIGMGTDIYTLGVILFELLTGRRPFMANRSFDLMRQIVESEPPVPSQFRSDVDPELDRICSKAMAKKIGLRYARMADFASTLEEYLTQRREAIETHTKKDSRRGQTIRTGQSGLETGKPKSTDVIGAEGASAKLTRRSGAASPGTGELSETNLEGVAPKESQSLFSQSHGYKLVNQIGKGQYGEVWLALAPGDVEVAVKKVLFPTGHRATQAELRALELVKGIRHSFLLMVQAYWIVEDQLMIVMELAEESLEDVLARHHDQGVPREQLFGYIAEAAEAIDFVHSEGVLHRDIKPANILLVKGHVKVGDFGIAMPSRLERNKLTVKSKTLGTPLYMAPELWEQQAGPRSDQYSLAVSFLELRLGRSPKFDDENRIIVDEQLPPEEQAIVRRGLSEDPAARYESCTEFANALQQIIDDEVLAAQKRVIQRRMLALVAVLLLVGIPGTIALNDYLTRRAARLAIPEGFEVAPGAKLISAGSRRLYDRIVRPVPGAPSTPESDRCGGVTQIEFVLIPRTENGDIKSFYCMKNKVSNDLYQQFYDEVLRGTVENVTPADLTEFWMQGPLVGNDRLPAKPPNCRLPVFGIYVQEAYAFAQWLGGTLPSRDQWDKAAGRWDHPEGANGPYREPGGGTAKVQIRHDELSLAQPAPVGQSNDDVSVFGCRDMAGNGQEWTRSTSDNVIEVGWIRLEQDAPAVPYQSDAQIDPLIRGRDYNHVTPLSFADLEFDEYWLDDIDILDMRIGFRCIAETRD